MRIPIISYLLDKLDVPDNTYAPSKWLKIENPALYHQKMAAYEKAKRKHELNRLRAANRRRRIFDILFWPFFLPEKIWYMVTPSPPRLWGAANYVYLALCLFCQWMAIAVVLFGLSIVFPFGHAVELDGVTVADVQESIFFDCDMRSKSASETCVDNWGPGDLEFMGNVVAINAYLGGALVSWISELPNMRWLYHWYANITAHFLHYFWTTGNLGIWFFATGAAFFWIMALLPVWFGYGLLVWVVRFVRQ